MLQKQRISIPFTSGLDSKISKIVKNNSVLEELENVQLQTKGEISKRHGSEIAADALASNITKVTSYNSELIQVLDDTLFKTTTIDGSGEIIQNPIQNDFVSNQKFILNNKNIKSVRTATIADVICTVYISATDDGTEVFGYLSVFNKSNDRFTIYNEVISVLAGSTPDQVDIVEDGTNFFIVMTRASGFGNYLSVHKLDNTGLSGLVDQQVTSVKGTGGAPLEVTIDGTHLYAATVESVGVPYHVRVAKILKTDLTLTALNTQDDPDALNRIVQSISICVDSSKLVFFTAREKTGGDPWILNGTRVDLDFLSDASNTIKTINADVECFNSTCQFIADGLILIAWDSILGTDPADVQVDIGTYFSSTGSFSQVTSDSADRQQLRGAFFISGDMFVSLYGSTPSISPEVIIPLRHEDIRTNVSSALLLFHVSFPITATVRVIARLARDVLGVSRNYDSLAKFNNRFTFDADGIGILERQYSRGLENSIPFYRNSIAFYSYQKTSPNFVVFKNLLFLTGNYLHMYDGRFLTEHQFLYEPKIVGDINYFTTSGGFSDGIVLVKITYQYTTANGDLIESQPSINYTLEFTGGTSTQRADLGTIKQYRGYFRSNSEFNDTDLVTTTVYRTELNGTVFHRTNDSSENITGLDESTLIQNATLYTESGEDGNIAIASCEYLTVFDDRLFITGGEYEGRILYSKPDSFDFYGLSIAVNIPTGNFKPNGLVGLDSRLLVFKLNSVFQVFGRGADNTGSGNYETARELPFEQGLLDENSLVVSTIGVLYKSLEGIYLVNRGLGNTYIGGRVEDFNGLTINAALSVDSSNEILFFTDTFTLVYDYENSIWSTNTGQNAITATNHLSKLHYCAGSGADVLKTDSSFTDALSYTMRFKTAWIKLAGITGFQRVWRGTIQGVYEGDHSIQLKIYYDYEAVSEETLNFTVSAGDMEIEFLPARQRCKSIAVEAIFTGDNHNCRINTIDFLVGIKGMKHRISKSERMT